MSSPAASARRRPRRLAAIAAPLVLVVVLAGACTGQHDPTGYSKGVRKNFITGCVAGYVPNGSKSDPAAASHRTYCGCIYDAMTHKKTGIAFKEFADAQSKIRENPTAKGNTIEKLIPQFQKYVAACTVGPTASS